MSGGMADLLAAHQPVAIRGGGRSLLCCGLWRSPRVHAAHQAEVLAAAGVGDLRSLLDDLRGLAVGQLLREMASDRADGPVADHARRVADRLDALEFG